MKTTFMKNLLLLVFLTLTFMSCEKDDSNERPAPAVYEFMERSPKHEIVNTMDYLK